MRGILIVALATVIGTNSSEPGQNRCRRCQTCQPNPQSRLRCSNQRQGRCMRRRVTRFLGRIRTLWILRQHRQHGSAAPMSSCLPTRLRLAPVPSLTMLTVRTVLRKGHPRARSSELCGCRRGPRG